MFRNIQLAVAGFSSRVPKIKIEKTSEYIYGANCVQIALNTNRRKIETLYVADSATARLNSRIANILNKANKLASNDNNFTVQYVKYEQLEKICPNQPHQNVILKCSTIDYLPIDSASELPKHRLCVYLDQLTDPQNVGAIIRSCYYFNVDAVIASNKNKCPLNNTVSKTSSGALELMDIYSVADPADFLRDWRSRSPANVVVSTAMPDNNNRDKLVQLHNARQKFKDLNIMLIVGSEGAGVSQFILKLSDYLLTIPKVNPQQFPGSMVDSLNVNAAVSTILYQMTSA